MRNYTSQILGTYSYSKKDGLGGISNVYYFLHSETDYANISVDGQTLKTFPSTTIYEIETFTASYNEKSELIGNDRAWRQTLSLKFPKMDVSSELHLFPYRKYSFIIVDRIGNIRMLGLYNGMECAFEGMTGTAKNDMNGYSLIFTGLEDAPAYYLSSLTDVGFTLEVDINLVTQQGCNLLFQDGSEILIQ